MGKETEVALQNALYDFLLFLASNAGETATVAEASKKEEAPAYIVMRYAIDDLFERMKHTTAVAGKSMFGPKGESLFELFVVTDDERSWYDMMLKNAVTKVYPNVAHLAKEAGLGFILNTGPAILPYSPTQAYTKGQYVKEAGRIFLCEEPVNGVSPLSGKGWVEQPSYVDSVGFVTIVLKPLGGMNTAMLTVMEASIGDALHHYIYREWCKAKGDINRAEMANQDYTGATDSIKEAAYFRNTPIRRKLSSF